MHPNQRDCIGDAKFYFLFGKIGHSDLTYLYFLTDLIYLTCSTDSSIWKLSCNQRDCIVDAELLVELVMLILLIK